MNYWLSKNFLWARDIQVRKWISSDKVIFDIPVHTLVTKNLSFKEVVMHKGSIEVIFDHKIDKQKSEPGVYGKPEDEIREVYR